VRHGGLAEGMAEARGAGYGVSEAVARPPARAGASQRPAEPARPLRREADRGQATPTGGESGGWLSGLLARASREEGEDDAPPARRSGGERAVRHTIESLDSLSVDIARMIDHQAVIELWDRYRRGERNVFTRRLYTLQGQQTFDEIRKKYEGDREFRQTVDRYIAEFERLLDEVSRSDANPAVAQSYLTSETGKVYTMLAHASGRFEDRG